MSFENIESCLAEIKNRYNENEKVRKKLVNYDEPIQITFLDSNRSAQILINKDQKIMDRILLSISLLVNLTIISTCLWLHGYISFSRHISGKK